MNQQDEMWINNQISVPNFFCKTIEGSRTAAEQIMSPACHARVRASLLTIKAM